MRFRGNDQGKRLQFGRDAHPRIEFKKSAPLYLAEAFDLTFRRYSPKDVRRVTGTQFERPGHLRHRKVDLTAVSAGPFYLRLTLHPRKTGGAPKLDYHLLVERVSDRRRPPGDVNLGRHDADKRKNQQESENA